MSMRYQDLTIEIASRQDGKLETTAFSDQFHDRPRTVLQRPIGRRALASIHNNVERALSRDSWDHAAQSPPDFGARMFRAVFQGPVLELFRKCRADLAGAGHVGLRIRVRFDARDDEAPYIADLPWELLFDPEDGQFLAADNRTPLVRQIVTCHRQKGPLEVAPPLRVLVVDAATSDMRAHKLKLERCRLRRVLESLVTAGEVEILVPRRPTFKAVRDALKEHDPHVLDFLGHGAYNSAAHLGALLLEQEGGGADLVDGARLADLLKGIPSLRLAVLNSCKSARHGGLTQPPGVYGAALGILTVVGLPAVVANQYTISQRAAVQFSATFYERIAKGDAVDEALAESRLRLRGQTFEWATPVLFLSAANGELFRVLPRRVAPAGCFTPSPGVSTPADSASAPPLSRATTPVKRGIAAALHLGIRSMVGLDPHLEQEAEHTLDLTHHFDVRFGDRRFIGNPGNWQSVIFPEVRAFLTAHYHDTRRPLVLHLAAHQSVAFAAGWVYEAKSGLDVAVKQHTQGRSLEWHPDDGSAPAFESRADGSRPHADAVGSAVTASPLWQPRDDIQLDSAGTDVAVAVGLTLPVLDDVRVFVEQQQLPVGRIIDAAVAPSTGSRAVLGGEHALRLAQSLLQRISQRRAIERRGRVHLFGAGPNAFFFYFGQIARSLGHIVLYEFPFGHPELGRRYQKSIELPPPEEVRELPVGW